MRYCPWQPHFCILCSMGSRSRRPQPTPRWCILVPQPDGKRTDCPCEATQMPPSGNMVCGSYMFLTCLWQDPPSGARRCTQSSTLPQCGLRLPPPRTLRTSSRRKTFSAVLDRNQRYGGCATQPEQVRTPPRRPPPLEKFTWRVVRYCICTSGPGGTIVE